MNVVGSIDDGVRRVTLARRCGVKKLTADKCE
jgi:hypothetical protein